MNCLLAAVVLLSALFLQSALGAVASWDSPIPSFLHKYWVPMDTKEALQFMTPYEVCMAKQYRSEKRCERFKTKLDTKLAGCAIHEESKITKKGMCPTAHHLYRFHTTRPWPKGINILSIIQIMRKHGSNTLVLIGDSVTMQSYYDIYCELIRYGMTFKHTSGLNNSMMVIDNPGSSKKKSSEVFFQIIYRMYNKEGTDKFSSVSNSVDSWLSGGHKNVTTVKGRVLFVTNVGLHYNQYVEEDSMTYNKTLATVASYLLSKAKQDGHIVMFRETSAQHFPTVDGRFGSPLLHPEVLLTSNIMVHTMAQRVFAGSRKRDEGLYVVPEFESCRPFENKEAVEIQRWRNHCLRSVLSELDPHKWIHLVPWFDATAARHDLHLLENGDCTHFCHQPMIWLPLWAEVYRALQKEFSRRAPTSS